MVGGGRRGGGGGKEGKEGKEKDDGRGTGGLKEMTVSSVKEMTQERKTPRIGALQERGR